MAQMELKGSRRTLRTICIVVAVLSALEMIFGVALFFAGDLLVGTTVEMDGQATDAKFAARVLGIVFFIGGLINLIIALMGSHGAKHSKTLGAFKVICIVGVILSVISIIAYIAQGQVSSVPSRVVVAVLQAVCAALAFRISNNETYAG